MKKVIINADDFGWDAETTGQTIRLLESGAITSATIMVDRPATAEALSFAKTHGKEFSFGLHFNLVDDHPPCSDNVPSLLNAEGNLKNSNLQRKDALFFRLDSREIRKEFECQLQKLLDEGIPVSHIDSHGHLHKFPLIITAIRPVMQRYGITKVRIPQDLFPQGSRKKALVNRIFRLFFTGLQSTDHFFMLENHEDPHWIDRFFSLLPKGMTELGIHPGLLDRWRQVETAPFLDGTMEKALRTHGVKLVTFHDL